MKPLDVQKRLLSLDAFRGATIAAMILANEPGTWDSIYPQLRHAAWNGWTFTDWIFPFFLWIVGVAMTFSFARRLEQGDTKTKLTMHVVRRTLIIFALGLFLAGFPFGLAFNHNFSFETIRIPGVLQRIGICYFFASIIYLNTSLRGQVLWIVTLLVGYWVLIKLVPVPGYGAGVLEPTGSLCWYVDSTLLKGHTWSGGPAPGFDPEGIVSTIPAIATTLFGALTGRWLRTSRSKEEKTASMYAVGVLMLFLGVILDMWLPINKNLWTSSYSIFMAGWALVCLATFYWFIDVKGHTRWAKPFVIYGLNAIAIYAIAWIVETFLSLIRVSQADGSTLSLQQYIFQNVYLPFANPINASLLYAITFVIVMFAVVWIMWERRWFVKI
jgi:predicted acyltransferase